jgi:hypothetical protein
LVTKRQVFHAEIYVRSSLEIVEEYERHLHMDLRLPTKILKAGNPNLRPYNVLLPQDFGMELTKKALPAKIVEIYNAVRPSRSRMESESSVLPAVLVTDLVEFIKFCIRYRLKKYAVDAVLLFAHEDSKLRAMVPFLAELPHLIIAFHLADKLSFATTELVGASLLRCLNDEFYCDLAWDAITQILETSFISWSFNDKAQLIRLIMLSVTQSPQWFDALIAELKKYVSEIRDTVLPIHDLMGLLSDFLGTIKDSISSDEYSQRKGTRSAIANYVRLERQKTPTSEEIQNIFTAEWNVTKKGVLKAGDILIFEPMDGPKNHPDLPTSAIEFRGFVSNMDEGKIEITIYGLFPPEIEQVDWKLYRIENATTHLAMLACLQEDRNWVHTSIVFDDEEKIRNATSSLRETGQLNEMQTKAVFTAMTRSLSLIWGPPAVGKTHTVAILIKQLLELDPDHRMLVTASTHQAVDNIIYGCEKVLDPSQLKNVIRIAGDREKVAPHSHKYLLEAHPEMQQSRYFSSSLTRRILNRSNLIFATATAGGIGVLKNQEAFDTVIVDEAGQLTYCNTLVAACKSTKRLVLIGDDKQLPATVHEDSKVWKFQESMFERLRRTMLDVSNCLVMLNVQYRMHPTLIRFSSSMFYNNGIQSFDALSSVKPFSVPPWNSQNHVCFVPTDLKTCRETRVLGTSFANEGEAKMVVEIVKRLLESKEVKQEDIGIITGYTGQLQKIKDVLSSQGLSSAVSVRTVDGFQGQERQAIIFSAVRSGDYIGFLKDDRRLNVMLTRAKRGLLVVGRKETLMLHATWKSWFELLEKKG